MAKNNFENDIARLEEIVGLLESGTCSLERSLSLFEEGIKLSKNCAKTLENAKQKISLLTESETGEE